MEKERTTVLSDLSLVIDRLPIASRLARHLLGDVADAKAICVALDLKLDEVNRLVRRNRMDTDDSCTVRHE
jgi:hypothetical protein